MAALGQAKQYSSSGQQAGGPAAAPPPPPRRVYPYHDGVSRSAQHYDLFEMIRNPNAGPATRPPDPPTPGELYEASLSKQFKIRRELEARFYSTGQILVGPAKVIRFLFMLLILPVYLLLYRLPHAILTSLLPPIWKRINNYVRQFSDFIDRTALRIVEAIKSPFIKLWQALTQEVELHDQSHEKSDHLDFFAFIAAGFVWAYRSITEPVKSAVLQTTDFVLKAVKYVNQLPVRFRNWRDRKREEFVEAISKFIGRFTFTLPKITLPKFTLPEIRFPTIELPTIKLPKIELPKITLPKFQLPKFKFPKIKISLPQIRFQLPRLPKWNFTLPKIRLPKWELKLPKIDLRPYLDAVLAKMPKKLPSLNINLPKIDLKPYLLPVEKAKDAVVLKVENATMKIRFFIAWTHILLRYGMSQVRQFTDSF